MIKRLMKIIKDMCLWIDRHKMLHSPFGASAAIAVLLIMNVLRLSSLNRRFYYDHSKFILLLVLSAVFFLSLFVLFTVILLYSADKELLPERESNQSRQRSGKLYPIAMVLFAVDMFVCLGSYLLA